MGGFRSKTIICATVISAAVLLTAPLARALINKSVGESKERIRGVHQFEGGSVWVLSPQGIQPIQSSQNGPPRIFGLAYGHHRL